MWQVNWCKFYYRLSAVKRVNCPMDNLSIKNLYPKWIWQTLLVMSDIQSSDLYCLNQLCRDSRCTQSSELLLSIPQCQKNERFRNWSRVEFRSRYEKFSFSLTEESNEAIIAGSGNWTRIFFCKNYSIQPELMMSILRDWMLDEFVWGARGEGSFHYPFYCMWRNFRETCGVKQRHNK